MLTPLHVLIVADQLADAELLVHALRSAGFDPTWQRAASEADYLAHLAAPLDLILAAYALPAFDAMRALQLLRVHQLDIPLIVVTESICEQDAVECIKLGAADYLLTDRLARLGSAVRQALTQQELRSYKRMAAAALLASEARFRAIFQSAALGMAIVDLHGQLLMSNPAFQELLGYTEDELHGRSFAAYTHPDDTSSSLARFNELVAGERGRYQAEKRYMRKDGQLLWARLSVALARDAENSPQFVVVTVEDITARKQVDATRARLAAIVDSTDDAIIGTALDGTIENWNAGAQRMYGYAPEEVIGQSAAILCPPARQHEFVQLLGRLQRGESIVQYETTRLHKAGYPIDVALTISPIRVELGSITGFSTIARDISERKQAEQALRRQATFVRLLQVVATAANQAASIEAALQTAIDQICAHIGWPVGHVYLAHDGGPYALASTDIWHLDDPVRFATFCTITEAVDFALTDDLPVQVLISGEPEWVTDVTTAPSAPRARLISDIGVRAGFAFPVLVGAEVAAVLEFFATEAITPDAALLVVMGHIGEQLGRVIERVRVAAALHESEARFRVLFEHSPDAIVLIDPHDPRISWPIVDCNDLACQMNGYTRAELIGHTIDILHDGAADPDERAAYLTRLRREGTIQLEAIHRRRDGTHCPIEVVSSLITVAGRELVLGIDRDISARKAAEVALRAAEAKYRTLVEQIPAIIHTTDIDAHGTSRYVSPQIAAILGWPPDEWLADPQLWRRQLHLDDRERVLAEMARMLQSDEPISLVYRLFTRDGRLVWLQDTLKVVRDEAGRPLFRQGIALDITDRKRAETALAEERNLLRLLIDTIPDEIYIKNAQCQFLNANMTVARMHGLASPDQLIGKTDFDLPKPYEQALADYHGEQAIFQSGQPMINRETLNHDKTEWRLETKIPFRDSQGHIVGLVGVNRLITEQKRAEEALRQAEQRYHDLFEEAPVMYVITHNQAGMPIIADCNAEFCTTIGYARAELLGRPLADCYTPDSRDQLVDGGYEQALAGTFSDQERALVARDGRVIQTLLRAIPEPAHDGQIAGTRAMYIDITERTRAEAALVEERALLARRVDERTADLSAANAELARAARLKDEFLASMSHELRTPLNAVLGLSEALQEEIYGPLTQQQRKSLQSIEESGRHLLELINDILDLAKIGAGKLDLESGSLSVAAVCQASLRLIKQEAHKKHLSVDLAIDPAVTLLQADARRLKQILANLLANAVKFTPAGGAIGLDVRGDAERQVVELTVWDTGIGIAREDLDRLFQPFVQIDSRLARQYNGTGLGLALVYRMVELHGGSVSVASEPGRGSRFTVALPWQLLDEAMEPIGPSPVAAAPVAIHNALIIEDSPTAAAQLVRYLDELGVTAVTSPQGADAVALALEARPDLIVLDILLGDTSGWKVLQRLKAEPRTAAIPVLIVSVVDDRAYGLAQGAADYLVKPLTRQDVQQALRNLAGMEPMGAGACAEVERAAPGARPTILLAEDSESNIATVSDYLSAKGYQVVVARNGAEAVARTRELQPALILMDIQMPGMDGLEATRRIRAQSDLTQISIIALTALAMPGDRERCLAAGANDYLSKPVSLKGLATVIETQLQRRSTE